MPIRPLLNAESGVFGPDELRDIVATFEALLTELRLTDCSDDAALVLAKLTIELAKKGQFNAASLRARVLKEMKPIGRVN
jgi:hypothetical protein